MPYSLTIEQLEQITIDYVSAFAAIKEALIEERWTELDLSVDFDLISKEERLYLFQTILPETFIGVLDLSFSMISDAEAYEIIEQLKESHVMYINFKNTQVSDAVINDISTILKERHSVLKKRKREDSSSVAIEPNYKIISDPHYIVPREKYIKRQLDLFFMDFKKENNLSIEGYQGQRYSSGKKITASNVISEMLLNMSLMYRYDGIPDMKNGHNIVGERIKRGLVLSHPTAGIIGGIYFEVNLVSKMTEINLLEIHEEFQGKRYGSQLLHGAILVGMLYGSTEFVLIATPEGMPIYFANGFTIPNLDDDQYEELMRITDPEQIMNYCDKYNFDYEMVLDLKERNLLELLKPKMQKSSPEFNAEVYSGINFNIQRELERLQQRTDYLCRHHATNPIVIERAQTHLQQFSLHVKAPQSYLQELTESLKDKRPRIG